MKPTVPSQKHIHENLLNATQELCGGVENYLKMPPQEKYNYLFAKVIAGDEWASAEWDIYQSSVDGKAYLLSIKDKLFADIRKEQTKNNKGHAYNLEAFLRTRGIGDSLTYDAAKKLYEQAVVNGSPYAFDNLLGLLKDNRVLKALLLRTYVDDKSCNTTIKAHAQLGLARQRFHAEKNPSIEQLNEMSTLFEEAVQLSEGKNAYILYEAGLFWGYLKKEKGLDYLRQADALGHAEASLELAKNLNADSAIPLLEKIIQNEKNSSRWKAQALYSLADIYYRKSEKDESYYIKSQDYLIQAAKLFYPQAFFEIALQLHNDRDIFAPEITQYLEACINLIENTSFDNVREPFVGHSYHFLGRVFREKYRKNGDLQDEKKFLDNFKKAFDSGYTRAYLELAEHYEYRLKTNNGSVEENYQEAYRYYSEYLSLEKDPISIQRLVQCLQKLEQHKPGSIIPPVEKVESRILEIPVKTEKEVILDTLDLRLKLFKVEMTKQLELDVSMKTLNQEKLNAFMSEATNVLTQAQEQQLNANESKPFDAEVYKQKLVSNLLEKAEQAFPPKNKRFKEILLLLRNVLMVVFIFPAIMNKWITKKWPWEERIEQSNSCKFFHHKLTTPSPNAEMPPLVSPAVS